MQNDVRSTPRRGGVRVVVLVTLIVVFVAGLFGLSQQKLVGQPNIILISLDTVRADRLGLYGAQRSPTPNLDRFAEEAVVFDNAYAVIGETMFSHASLFTSRYPSELSTMDYRFSLPPDVPNLPQVLGLYGYETSAVTAGGHLSDLFGFEQGFDHFESPRHWASFYDVLPPTMQWLDSRAGSDPFFLLLHSYDAHARYMKPSPYGFAFANPEYRGTGFFIAERNAGVTRTLEGRFFPKTGLPELLDWDEPRLLGPANKARLALRANDPDEESRRVTRHDVDFVRGVYDGALFYADMMFGVTMAELDRRGLLENSIIIVLSDHGEELGERGLFNHRFSLNDAVLKVPLLVRMPEGAHGGRRISEWVSLLDIMPTLLEVVGAELPAGTRGKSFVAALEGGSIEGHEALFSENVFRMMSIKHRRGRLTFSGVGGDSPFAADLLASARIDGPAFELDEGLDASSAELLRAELEAWRRALPSSPRTQREVSDELRSVLQEQGYWGPM